MKRLLVVLMAVVPLCGQQTFPGGTSSGGGSGTPTAATWGSITGPIGNQTDLTSALAAKQATLTIGNFTETASSILTITGGTGAVIGSGLTVQVKQASGSQSGFLSSTDWTAFNGKQAALGFTPESLANKNGASGYAGLTAGSLLNFSQIPVGTTSTSVAVGNDARFLTTFGQVVGLWTTCTTGYLKYDGTCSVPATGGTGTVTSFSVAGVPAWLASSVATSTTTPALTLSAASGQTAHQVVGTCGAATTFGPCALVAGDIPVLNQNTTGTAANVTGTVALANGGTGSTTASAALTALGAQPALGYTPENAANKNLTNGYAGLSGGLLSSSQVPVLNQNTTGTAANVTGTVAIANGGTSATTASAALTALGAQAALGFTPENAANKNAASGYAGLTAGSLLNFSQIPVGTSSTSVAIGNDSRFLTSFGAVVGLWTSCTSGYLKYDGTCATPSGGGTGTVTSFSVGSLPSWLTSSVATASSTPALTIAAASAQTAHQVIGTCGSGTTFGPCALVAGDIPTLNQSTTGTAANVTGTVAVANGGTGSTTASAALTALGAQSSLGFTPENAANKNATNGYAGLTSGLITSTQIPTLNQNTTGTAANVTGTVAIANGGTNGTTASAALTALGAQASLGFTPENVANKNATNGYAGLSGGLITSSQVPTLNQNTTGTAANVTGTVTIANGGTNSTTAAGALTSLGAAPLASPTFTGTPAAPTAVVGTNTTQVGTTAFTAAAIASVVTAGSTYPSNACTNGVIFEHSAGGPVQCVNGLQISDDYNSLDIRDDFLGGGTGGTSIGEFGWALNWGAGAPTVAINTSIIQNHPGVVNITTPATSGVGFTLDLPAIYTSSTGFLLRFIAESSSISNVGWRMGGGTTATTQGSATGAYFRYDTKAGIADTTWHACNVAGSTETCVDTGITPQASKFYNVVIYSLYAGQVAMSIGSGDLGLAMSTPTTICASGCTITATPNGYFAPYVNYFTNAATAVTLTVDYAEIKQSPIVR